MEARCTPRDQGSPGLPPVYKDSSMSSRTYHDESRIPFTATLSTATSSTPIAIPNLPRDYRPPPPLPPPRVVPIDGPMSAAADEYRRRERELAEDLHSYQGRSDQDEVHHSVESISRDSALSNRFAMHRDNYHFKSSADAYDNSLLKKLDMRRTLDSRSPPCHSHPGAPGPDALRSVQRPPRCQPLSLPTRVKLSHGQLLYDSPSRYSESSMYSSVSPRTTPSDYCGSDQRSLRGETPMNDRSIGDWTCRTNSGSMLIDTGTQDAMYDDIGFNMEETRPREFRFDRPNSRLSSGDDCHAAGQKRPASSPPGSDEVPLPMYNIPSNEHLRWRESVSRGSPAPRLSTNMQDSISSISSSTRTNSYSSNLSAAASSVTSMAVSIDGGGGPGGRLLGGDCFSPTETTGTTPTSTCASPFAASMMLSASPQAAVVASRSAHHRIRETSHIVSSPTRRIPEALKPTSLKRSEFYMCECCPKKPKKFDSPDQLRAHEMEKQYECSFCGNRFKNKNEAERHQNSLHVRHHSWSCAALSSYDRAFHESTFRCGEADTCGYCGEEFLRTGPVAGRSDARQPTEQDWDDRIRHLQDVHKFRECNASKKFFRADHFRQHLKHSHAGTSGKWTNMLENACMTEEQLPLPMQ
ncbi:hypothetical protein SEPCBS57363_004311 [Sporothrix epigloea]|uniref:C2H2-type domain-containing protein n=1 Tax=Sporothrix epigloea TaxID=1892477 RepID=A0ABP0DSJ8_9PEZI